MRRDAEPHRGWLLYGLGAVAVLQGLAGVPCAFPVLFAFPLAVATYTLAERDLEQMRAGIRDARGEGVTRDASYFARAALLVGAGVICFWGLHIR